MGAERRAALLRELYKRGDQRRSHENRPGERIAYAAERAALRAFADAVFAENDPQSDHADALRAYVSDALDELDYRRALAIVEDEFERAELDAERAHDARCASAAERIMDSHLRCLGKSAAIDAKCAELAADRASLTTSEKDKLDLGLRILLAAPR